MKRRVYECVSRRKDLRGWMETEMGRRTKRARTNGKERGRKERKGGKLEKRKREMWERKFGR